MFALIRRGLVRASLSDQYLCELHERILPAYRAAEGNRDVLILRAMQGEFTVFLLLSFWDSRDAPEQFRDPQLNAETNCPERKLVLAFESTATLYELMPRELNCRRG